MNDGERRGMIRRIKDAASDGMRFPIRREDLSVIGYLRHVTPRDLSDDLLISAMADARTRHGRSFLTRFDVSQENKRGWLRSAVIESTDRLLFIVETADGTAVGQDGMTLLGDGVFELDGTLRFAAGGERGLFARSGVERAGICFSLLDASHLVTEIFSDNPQNTRNSIKMGFTAVREHRLCISESGGKLAYSKIADGREPNTDRTLVDYEMTRERFAGLEPAVFSHPHRLAPGHIDCK